MRKLYFFWENFIFPASSYFELRRKLILRDSDKTRNFETDSRFQKSEGKIRLIFRAFAKLAKASQIKDRSLLKPRVAPNIH